MLRHVRGDHDNEVTMMIMIVTMTIMIMIIIMSMLDDHDVNGYDHEDNGDHENNDVPCVKDDHKVV